MNTKFTRIQKARLVANLGLCKVMRRDRLGRVNHVLVPGSDGKQYNVYLKREKGLVAECQLITGVGEKPCQGNHVTLCTHCMSALLVAADAFETALCKNILSAYAVKRLHPGAKVTSVTSKQANKTFYLVTWR